MHSNIPLELHALKQSGIYMILNIVDGKCYIGSTVKFGPRFNKHVNELSKNRHHSRYLQFAWNKYGPTAFEFKVLQAVGWLHYLETIEQEWIDWLNCTHRDFGYNLCPVAGSPLGIKRSAETRAKMREASQNRLPASADTRVKMSSSAKIKVFDVDHRENMRLAQTGREHTADTKAKMSNAAKGKPKSSEHKIKSGLAKRDFNKWPHYGGNKCKCSLCKDKRASDKRVRYWNIKASKNA